jgi:hypothetical protein
MIGAPRSVCGGKTQRSDSGNTAKIRTTVRLLQNIRFDGGAKPAISYDGALVSRRVVFFAEAVVFGAFAVYYLRYVTT